MTDVTTTFPSAAVLPPGPGAVLTGASSDAPAPVPAAERGTLEIRTPAIAHIIEHLVLEVPSVVTRRSRGLGAGYPRASVQVQGAWASARVEVAALWPTRVADVADEVRRLVLDRVEPMVGVQVRRADVTVHVVAPTADELPGRVS